jgi:UDP-N-acetyl-D-mannosaminuronate dehydrogenase
VREKPKIVVVGLGEIGKPLLQLISEHHDALGVDISPVDRVSPVDVMHICFPFQVPDFIGETARYIEYFQPALTVINSTVGVSTTRSIAERTGAAVVNSPVRGKHARMLDDLRHYTKFVGGIDARSAERAAAHFQSLGLKTKVLPSPEATELAKLTETTYFGLMIAWAQEVERYADQIDQNYEDIIAFYDEINFFPPVKYFPGIIGGHCVLPNIEILRTLDHSTVLTSIVTSNEQKIQREARKQAMAEQEQASEATKAS